MVILQEFFRIYSFLYRYQDRYHIKSSPPITSVNAGTLKQIKGCLPNWRILKRAFVIEYQRCFRYCSKKANNLCWPYELLTVQLTLKSGLDFHYSIHFHHRMVLISRQIRYCRQLMKI